MKKAFNSKTVVGLQKSQKLLIGMGVKWEIFVVRFLVSNKIWGSEPSTRLAEDFILKLLTCLRGFAIRAHKVMTKCF
ncbi:hypothetical protein H4V97_002823 [Flavobacterium sp. CG_23.5]|uniref:hypothetical protein n=1 Tax=unclassified Flavobacterium TaxID=196869 RepID=UPI0018CB46A7|nr:MULTISPECIES: hypothetical protein [unclassified Flavobacterium]MBG6112193.1 hypothetical protein [Flavobacterium sp. CG_9.10]MBP2284505.1 hypothetical protein [Flavobacterium sp. CG_23.5]